MNGREKLNLWQDRLYNSLSAYSSDLSDMDRREALYCGTHTIYSAVGAKNASCVRNIVSELIEAEAETTIPRPKVTARRKADEKKAELVEAFLINELDRLPFEKTMLMLNELYLWYLDRTEREQIINKSLNLLKTLNITNDEFNVSVTKK